MSQLLRLAQIRQIERNRLANLPAGTLMTRAAAAVAAHASQLAASMQAPVRLLILAGPGNNGADALLAGLMLSEQGFLVQALCHTLGQSSRHAPRPVAAANAESDTDTDTDTDVDTDTDADADAHADVAMSDPTESERVLAAFVRSVGPLASLSDLDRFLSLAAPAPSALHGSFDWASTLVIDGLLGIGQRAAVTGVMHDAIETVNTSGLPIIAVDVPTGVNSDTGALFPAADGNAGAAIRAQCTVTMIADKPGLRTGAALDYCGQVIVADLGLGQTMPMPCATAESGELFDASMAGRMLKPRLANSHKGSHGSVLIIGGAAGMTGAALLAASGAQAGGAGKVFIATQQPIHLAAQQAQWLTQLWPASSDVADAIAIGCGLGSSAAANEQLASVLRRNVAMVLDADALNTIAQQQQLQRPNNTITVLTPHPLEAARLLGETVMRVQADRVGAARKLAQRYAATIVLKGAGSVCADPYGNWSINSSGAPSLASAGTGDVLAGLIAALLAQRHPAWDAVRLAVWAHGLAGERLQRNLPMASGLSASELFEPIRTILNGR